MEAGTPIQCIFSWAGNLVIPCAGYCWILKLPHHKVGHLEHISIDLMRLNYNTVYSRYIAVGGVQAMVLRYKWEHDISGDCHEPTSDSIFWCVFSDNGAFVFKHIGNKAFNTPQPLDQWTNSPFIGQQVGNCKSFTLTHYLANLFAKHHGPRSIPLCIQHHIQFTSLSFQVSRPSHSEIKQLQYFTLKI